jgi:hypothetical protein
MKTISRIALLLVMFISTISSFAQDKVYTEGSVWSVSFIKTNTGMEDQYIKDLKSSWRVVHDEALRQGLILSYKILAGSAAYPQDYDMMLLVEYKNLAGMEGNQDKWDAIFKKVIGNDDAMSKLMATRVNTRTIFGEKLFREVVYK